MPESLIARVLAGETRAIARAMSLIENESADAGALIAGLHRHTGRAYLIGITGVPGSGKSTLVDRLTAEIRRDGLSVGVIAVDPTSPFTGGAILGDRVRMGAHAHDEGVFVRSMATRGHLGGLARATGDLALVLDAAGRDVVIIETVGVGQDEVEIVGTADVSVVVLVPGTGDDVQAIKAGIMEIGDIFVVNKADRDGAGRLVQAVAASLSLVAPGPEEWRPLILETTAIAGTGVRAVWDAVRAFREHPAARPVARRRVRQQGRLRERLGQRFLAHVERTAGPGALQRIADRVAAREIDPDTAAAELMDRALGGLPGVEPRTWKAPDLQVKTIDWGDLRLTALHDGPLRLDGGAMFGVVPRPLWERLAPPDERNRIALAMRPLLVEASWGRMLVDCGAGTKMDARLCDIYGLERDGRLDEALAAVGLSSESIDMVLATHLHFDHFGGATLREHDRLRPRFPRAEYVIRAAEWEDATHPHERNRASYLLEDFVPLREAGVASFFDGDATIRPGVRVLRTGGHTGQHQIVFLESAGRTAVFTADLLPTTAHLQDAWIMGYDLFPMETLAFKRRFVREAIEHEYLIFFEHDPHVAAGVIRERNGRRYVDQVL